jgi:hypothetical protein
MKIIFHAETYKEDYPLFERLGLSKFVIKDRNKHLVGVYRHPIYEYSFVEIWVTCRPAMFWEFKVKTTEEQVYTVATGSGSLKEYWHSVELILEGMLVMEKKMKK